MYFLYFYQNYFGLQIYSYRLINFHKKMTNSNTFQAEKINQHIVKWLLDYATNAKVNGFVVGISGGIDSALTSTLCAQTGLPTLCVEMPIHQAESHVNRANEHIAQLKNSQMFLGASPPAAAGLYAFMKAEKLYKEQLEKLTTNSHQLAKVLAESNNWHFVNDFPVFFYKNADLSTKLLQQKILVSSFPYPDKNGPTVNRIVLSSWHSKADVEKLIQAIT